MSDHPYAPDINLSVVWLFLDNLWSEIEWGSNRLVKFRFILVELGKSEVCKLYIWEVG